MQAAPQLEVRERGVRLRPLNGWLASRRRLMVAAALLCVAVIAARQIRQHYPRTPLRAWLADRDLVLSGDPIAMTEQGGVVLLAREGENAPADVYWLEAGWLGEGRIAGPRGLYNLTHTAGADESGLVRIGSHVAFRVRVGDRYTALELLDFAGERAPRTDVGARFRRRVTNWQQTGLAEGIARYRYRFSQPVQHARLTVQDEQLTVDAGLSGSAHVSLEDGRVLAGQKLVQGRRIGAVVGAWVPWLVDSVRSISWVGPEPIAWLEQRVFGVRDSLQRAYRQVQRTDHAAEVAEAMPQAALAARVEALAIPDPESGWPPEAVPAVLKPAVKGEGEWQAVVDDPFVRSWPSGPPLFFQSFLRGDPERPYNRVYLTLWDPRQLQLHIVSGVEEPISATGETGTGTIPKDPRTLERVVAAFNGGFQAMHGEFGMMAGGQVYLPPKPWAATVAVYEDGSVGMGSWPGPEDRRRIYDEATAVATIPSDMLAMRQNLTSLVEDGRFNPWERWWWGAAPSQSDEQTLTQRSALCLRDDGFMLYAWGDFMSPEALGRVLVAAECARAMHLDMNAGHTGFEFYNVLAPDEHPEPVKKKRFWEFEQPLHGHPGYLVRARKAVTAMQMPMPRYIHRDPRDFFYLTIKPTLPGPAAPDPGQGASLEFSTKNLPHAGWPPALARHESEELRLLRIDPRRVDVAPAGSEGALVELVVAEPAAGTLDVYLEQVPLAKRAAVGEAPEGAKLLGRGPDLRSSPTARAWLGVDADGFLVYGESDAPQVPNWMSLLARLGVQRAVALRPRERLGLRAKGHLLAPDGRTPLPARAGATVVALAGSQKAAARVVFPDTEPRPYRFWAFLQDQRVRYFRTAPPTARAPGDALAPGAVSQEAPASPDAAP